MLHLESNNLYSLLIYEWSKEEKKTKKYKKKSSKALQALYQAVSKDLYTEIYHKLFIKAWDALATARGKNLVVRICEAYCEVNRMVYQSSTPLPDHIQQLKTAYT
jgi:hypothetical protein